MHQPHQGFGLLILGRWLAGFVQERDDLLRRDAGERVNLNDESPEIVTDESLICYVVVTPFAGRRFRA